MCGRRRVEGGGRLCACRLSRPAGGRVVVLLVLLLLLLLYYYCYYYYSYSYYYYYYYYYYYCYGVRRLATPSWLSSE